MTESDERTVDRRAASRMNRDDDEPVGASEGDAGTPQAGSEPQDATAGDAALADLREKADTYYRNWQRSMADFINYKRRIEQEKGETSRFATAALIINLLPVYDDLERAVNAIDAQLAGLNWVQGVVAIQRKFWSMLEAMGVSEIPTSGDFDPAHHEAVARQPGPEGRVLHVAQKGYQLGERVIRPAMVIVGQGEHN